MHCSNLTLDRKTHSFTPLGSPEMEHPLPNSLLCALQQTLAFLQNLSVSDWLPMYWMSSLNFGTQEQLLRQEGSLCV